MQEPTKQERRLVTMKDWEEARDFGKAARPGDYVTDEIANEMLNVMPPALLRWNFFQVGEPHSHETDPRTGKYRPTFPTFAKKCIDEDAKTYQWMYCGNCFLGEWEEPAARKEKTE